MSNRLGTPQTALRATGAVAAVTSPSGNGAILTIPFGINQWCALCSLAFVWVASATVGTRTISVLVKDASGNIIWQTTIATGLVASTTLNGFLGQAVPISNNAGPPITFYAPIPMDLPIPPGAAIEVIDTASIAITDTCSITAIITG